MTLNEAAKARLGKRLRQIRIQHRRTIKGVADEIGVSAPALWRWEKGEARPRDKNLSAFAKLFKVSEAQLLSGADEAAIANDAGASAAVIQLERPSASAKPVLSDVIDDSKERIARVAGAVPAQIKIIIEV